MPFGQDGLIIELSVIGDLSVNMYHLLQDNIIIPGVARMRIFIYPVFRDR